MRKGINAVFILTFAFILLACGASKQLSKVYVGKPASAVLEKFGQPKVVLDRNEGQVYIYEKVEELRSTEISQGKLTLDPIVTPMVDKTERYYFTIKDSVVVDAKFEEVYER